MAKNLITRAPRGTQDMLPANAHKWHYVESVIRDHTKTFGYKEIRTPSFEHTVLFLRGIGDTTDVVEKEMYTFNDAGDRSITLKPEGTAGAARAFLENAIYAQPQPTKMYYMTPVFRYEKPQAGRFREHHQFGIEVYGAKQASIDAEVISLAIGLFKKLGITGLKLNLNSIGCKECRPKYLEKLKEYLYQKKEGLCYNCNSRLERNPLRVLDCKNPECRAIVNDAPSILDFLCEECNTHFEAVKKNLDSLGIEYIINNLLVRGLDYYTKTVFELITDTIGAQGTVCGGGRYDGLISELGGNDTPGIGFGMGLERLLMVMEKNNVPFPAPESCQVFLVAMGQNCRDNALRIVNDLRQNGIIADMDHIGKSVKAQFKYADKINAKNVCILGDDELNNNSIKIKNMETGEEKTVSLENLAENFK